MDTKILFLCFDYGFEIILCIFKILWKIGKFISFICFNFAENFIYYQCDFCQNLKIFAIKTLLFSKCYYNILMREFKKPKINEEDSKLNGKKILFN